MNKMTVSHHLLTYGLGIVTIYSICSTVILSEINPKVLPLSRAEVQKAEELISLQGMENFLHSERMQTVTFWQLLCRDV